GVQTTGADLYARWDSVMDPKRDDPGSEHRGMPFAAPPPPLITRVDELNDFIAFLKAQFGIGGAGGSSTSSQLTQLSTSLSETLDGCKMLLQELNLVGKGNHWSGDDLLKDTNQNTDLARDIVDFPNS